MIAEWFGLVAFLCIVLVTIILAFYLGGLVAGLAMIGVWIVIALVMTAVR